MALILAVAASFPLLVASAWRPGGEAPDQNLESMIEDPANAVAWLGIAFVWVVTLVLLVGAARRGRRRRRAAAEGWEDEW